jgi:hypothetical protein
LKEQTRKLTLRARPPDQKNAGTRTKLCELVKNLAKTLAGKLRQFERKPAAQSLEKAPERKPNAEKLTLRASRASQNATVLTETLPAVET